MTLESFSKLIGMDVKMLKKSQTWQMEATQELAKLIDIKSGSEVGVLKKENNDACAKNVDKWEYSPAFLY